MNRAVIVEHQNKLEKALKQISKTARKDIQATLQGDQTVIARRWTATYNDEVCGCLLMDGHTAEYVASRSSIEHGHWLVAKYKMRRYDSRDKLDAVVTHYDDWAHSDADCFSPVENEPFFILQPKGREIILAMLNRIDA